MRPSPRKPTGGSARDGGASAGHLGTPRLAARPAARQVRALSADAELLALERSALGGRIHSVFASVVNVSAPEGELWCLAARGIACGPRTVRIELASFDGLALAPAMAVTVSDAIRLGDVLTVPLDGARSWAPPTIDGSVDSRRVQELEAALAEAGVPGGAQAGDDAFSRAVSERIRDGLEDIANGIRCADEDAITRAAGRLVGLGGGLTPAGDDVLTGLAYASAQLGGPLSLVPAAIRRAAASGATHAISLTAMREACRGRAVEPLGDLLAALCTTGPADGSRGGASIPKLTVALTGIGHTSGTDQAHGLLAAVRLTEEMRGM